MEEQQEKYPFLIRLYGVLSIAGAIIQIAGIVLLVLLFVGILTGDIDIAQLDATGHVSITTLVIAAVLLLLSAALAVMFFVLGVRLLRGNRRKVALLTNIMIGLEVGVLLCQFMLRGLCTELIPPFVNMIILIALETYSDPALRDERRLQRRLLQLENKAAAEDGTLGRDTTGKGYIALNFYNIFWVFVICCVIGLILEIIWHMTVVELGVYQDRAGLLYGPFSPIYGIGAVLMTIALNRYYNKNPLVVFLVAGLIGAAFEYFVSWFMETAFGIVAWDYTGTFLNINGRTNFMFFCIWGLLGLAWVRYLLPIMLKAVNIIRWDWRYGITSVCTVLMLIDAGLTLAAFDCWYQRVGGTMDYKNASAIVEFCNEHYDNGFMENRFQSMTIDPDAASRA